MLRLRFTCDDLTRELHKRRNHLTHSTIYYNIAYVIAQARSQRQCCRHRPVGQALSSKWQAYSWRPSRFEWVGCSMSSCGQDGNSQNHRSNLLACVCFNGHGRWSVHVQSIPFCVNSFLYVTSDSDILSIELCKSYTL